MSVRPWHVAVLAAVALPALWLLFAGPQRLLGVDTGQAGMALLVTAAWTSLVTLSKLPRGDAEATIAPGEWKAWIGVAFMAVAVAYFATRVDVFAGAGVGDHAARAVGRNLVLLLVAWLVLTRVMAARWKGAVEEDERDRAIAATAAAWGHGALVVAVLVVAVTLGFSPPRELAWATHFMVANVLVLSLMCAWLVEYAASAVLYLHERSR